MIVLGIETATAVCGAAVLRGGAVASDAVVEAPQVHSEKLVPIIELVIRESGIRPADLDAVAVSIGPGSFTGLRIGLSAAKGICFALGKPIIAVPTLEGMANRCNEVDPGDGSEYLLPLLDARREECYAALYAAGKSFPVETLSARAVHLSMLAEFIAGRKPVRVIAETALLEKIRLILGPVPGIRFCQPAMRACHPASIAAIGGRMFMEGKISDLPSLEPLYVKEFITTTQSHHSIAE